MPRPSACKKFSLILSCEHASARVPPRYARLFEGQREILATHRAVDLGAWPIAQVLRRRFRAPLYGGKVTRLLVDLNRSLHNARSLHSEFTKHLSAAGKRDLYEKYYLPYRDAVEKEIRRRLGRGESVFHLSVHSFTPELRGVTRNADVGLLFDPSFRREKNRAAALRRRLKEKAPDLRIRYNYPYKGTMDGFTTYLRRELRRFDYVSLEIEINQRFYFEGAGSLGRIAETLAASIEESAGREAFGRR